jgi:hypothetical protein
VVAQELPDPLANKVQLVLQEMLVLLVQVLLELLANLDRKAQQALQVKMVLLALTVQQVQLDHRVLQVQLDKMAQLE